MNVLLSPLLLLVLLNPLPGCALIDVSYNLLYLPTIAVRNRTCEFSRILAVERLRIDANRSCIDSVDSHSFILNQNEGIVDLPDEVVRRNKYEVVLQVASGDSLRGFFSLNESEISTVHGINLTLTSNNTENEVEITVFVAIRVIDKSTSVNFALGVLLGAILVALFCGIAFLVRSWPNLSPLESSDSLDPLTAADDAPSVGDSTSPLS